MSAKKPPSNKGPVGSKQSAEASQIAEVERHDYPTHEQMKEVWDAWRSGRRGAITEVLRKWLDKETDQ